MDTSLSRRHFLLGAGAAVAGAGLAACGSSPKTTGSSGTAGSKPATLTFTTWASDPEKAAFQQLISQFEAANPTIKVNLQVVPFEQIDQDITARLSSGNAPDVFRVTYTDLGTYSSKQALLDLTPYVDSSFKAQFAPAYYAAIEFNGKPFGIPHQTDTTALFYNKDMFASAGITSVPTTLASAWTWEEFLAVAQKLRGALPSNVYPFIYDWASAGAYRWLSWLFQAGGNLLTTDLAKPAIDSPAGIKAVEFTQSFFTDKLVPQNSSTGSATYPDTLFLSQTVAMAFAADFLLPADIDGAKFPFGVTYMPRSVAAASDLGGNGVVAAAQTKAPEATATFLKYLASNPAMSLFCAKTNELPTRVDLAAGNLPWAADGQYMPTFVQQATSLSPFQVQQVTIPAFSQINTLLKDELDSAFLKGQSPTATVKAIASGVTTAIAQA